MDLLRGGRRAEPALARLEGLGSEELCVSIHVVCELSAGAALSGDPEAGRARMLSLVEPLALALPDHDFPRVSPSFWPPCAGEGRRSRPWLS